MGTELDWQRGRRIKRMEKVEVDQTRATKIKIQRIKTKSLEMEKTRTSGKGDRTGKTSNWKEQETNKVVTKKERTKTKTPREKTDRRERMLETERVNKNRQW